MRSILVNFLSFILRVKKSTIDFVIADGKNINILIFLFVPSVVIGTILYQISPLVIKYTLDLLINPDSLSFIPFFQNQAIFESIIYLIIFAIILDFVDRIFNLVNQLFSYKIAQVSEKQMEQKYFEKLATFDLTFLGTDNNIQILRAVGYIITFMQKSLLGLINTIIKLPTSIISLLFILPILHPYFFILIVISAIINLSLNAYSSQQYRKWSVILTRSQSQRFDFRYLLFYRFGNFYFNGLFDTINKKYDKIREKVFDLEYKRDTQNTYLNFINNFVSSLISFAILLLGAYMVIIELVTIGTLALINSYLARFNSLFSSIGELFESLLNLNLDLTRVEFILNLKPKLNHIYPSNTPENIERIKFDNVSFRYPEFYEEEKEYFQKLGGKIDINNNKKGFSKLFNTILKSVLPDWKNDKLAKEFNQILSVFEGQANQEDILKGINLELTKGQSYSLIGKNGAGKSTLLNLLKRGFDATNGKIIINDQDIRQVDKDEWKNRIVSIEQNLIDFNGILNLQDQLLISTIDSKKEEKEKLIPELLKLFGLDKLITDYSLMVGENLMLSGGQKQILELIRILLSDKQIVILDEATNQLDAEKELIFINSIKKYLPNSFVIFVTHRMSTCLKTDQIISLKNGVVEGIGNPKEMLKYDNEFRRFYDIQK